LLLDVLKKVSKEQDVFHDTMVEVPMTLLSAGCEMEKKHLEKRDKLQYEKETYINNIERRGKKYNMRDRRTDRSLLTMHICLNTNW
jgi:hypothetical protein